MQTSVRKFNTESLSNRQGQGSRSRAIEFHCEKLEFHGGGPELRRGYRHESDTGFDVYVQRSERVRVEHTRQLGSHEVQIQTVRSVRHVQVSDKVEFGRTLRS